MERALINLGIARIEYNDEDIANGTRVKTKIIEFIHIYWKHFVFFRVLEIHFPLLQILVVF